MLGGETPMHGSETPGSRTPGYADGGDSWNITENDVLPTSSSSSAVAAASAAAASSGVTPFGYSSAQTFGSNSVNSTPLGSHMSWEENYVVVFKKGGWVGKYGVVRRRPAADGLVRVSLFDPMLQTADREERDVPHTDMVLAEPGKKCRIKVWQIERSPAVRGQCLPCRMPVALPQPIHSPLINCPTCLCRCRWCRGPMWGPRALSRRSVAAT